MLDLDDPYWQKLSHAYGSAADIPELLRQLARETTKSTGMTASLGSRFGRAFAIKGSVHRTDPDIR